MLPPDPSNPIREQTLTRLNADSGDISSAAPATPVSIAPGTRIDQYVLLEPLGQGGMGVVYRAQQERPRRTVAIKLIRPGLATPEVQRRFEREAELLGQLQHPGIAQVYEAGTFDAGHGPQPYFVMELVNGRPLTEFAQTRRLGTRARVELMVRVCDAVQHAHLKGVIHRDLKPGNILVAEEETGEDSRVGTWESGNVGTEKRLVAATFPPSHVPTFPHPAQPKILDFGVARSTNRDAQLTLQTTVGQIVGTLSYMAPEQMTGRPEDVDTRSDVYALGVMLFELLTGQLPHKTSGQSLPDALRLIRETPAPRLAAVEPTLRGDLDTITTHALEKDKERRYASAGDLAADLRRYLTDETISVRPPGTLEQVRKFARRHKTLVGGIAATFIALVAGVGVSTNLALRARAAERLAAQRLVEAQTARRQAESAAADALTQAKKADQVSGFLRTMLAAIDPEQARGRDTFLLRELLEEATRRVEAELKGQPEVEAAVRTTIGLTYRQLGEYATALPHLERAYALQREAHGPDAPETLGALAETGRLRWTLGDFDAAERAGRTVLSRREAALGTDDLEVASSLMDLAAALQRKGQYADAEPLFRRALDIRQRKLGAAHEDTALALNNLAVLLGEIGHFEEAESLHRRVLEIRKTRLGERHLDTLLSMQNLGVVLEGQGKYGEAEPLYRTVLAEFTRVYGPRHPLSLQVGGNLVMALAGLERFEEAETLQRAVVTGFSETLGNAHATTLVARNNLGLLFYRMKRYEPAEEIFAAVLAARRRLFDANHPDLALSLNNLARVRELRGAPAAAEPLYREALAAYAASWGADHPIVAATQMALGECLLSQNKFADAEGAFREALRIRAGSEGASTTQLVEAEWGAGRALLGQKKYNEAEPFCLRAYERAQSSGADPAVLKNMAGQIADLYEALAHPQNAAAWRARAGSPP